MSLLNGSPLVLPYHTDGFVGALEADGQQVKVAAIACDGERVVMLSLVGYDTSVGVMLGRLWSGTKVEFHPSFAWADEWHGETLVQRAGGSYRTVGGELAGVREVHVLALLRSASIREGILNPPELPEPPTSEADEPEHDAQEAPPESATPKAPPQPKSPPWITRYLLGNWHEITPSRSAFQGHLAALRIPILYRHEAHPDWPDTWADALWERGLSASLIAPIDALGIRAWRVSGDLLAWGQLVGTGIREGWLPWRD
jgi:hypothetical protein